MKVIIFVIFLFVSFNCLSQTTKDDLVKVYDTFEEFSEVLNRTGEKTYVVNFWATWCKPCIAELPYFNKLAEEHSNDDIEVILVSLDFKNRIKKSLIPFIEKNNIKTEVVLLADNRSNEWIDKVDESWSGAIPATLIYNQDSYQFLEHEFESYEELKTLIEQFKKS